MGLPPRPPCFERTALRVVDCATPGDCLDLMLHGSHDVETVNCVLHIVLGAALCMLLLFQRAPWWLVASLAAFAVCGAAYHLYARMGGTVGQVLSILDAVAIIVAACATGIYAVQGAPCGMRAAACIAIVAAGVWAMSVQLMSWTCKGRARCIAVLTSYMPLVAVIIAALSAARDRRVLVVASLGVTLLGIRASCFPDCWIHGTVIHMHYIIIVLAYILLWRLSLV